ncbi:hypothetical protein DSL72_001883 [Monilinia vaccinii-corymbosi]|uniref:C3H1-type domain-containing protein n=1 Tax=Monilinia vaccinii-corymbosi TaxID=61207 RepID=A0A8A3PB36_9HELO|nr:hypothetical protein DSL72_001883 [Monilinia vaccinii-corymbosi]
MPSSEANDRNEWPITPDILGTETATIRCNGSEGQEITFHTKPLTRLSPRFAQFCRMKKQPDGRFTLICAPNKYDAFTCIALYVYHGKVPTPSKDIDSNYTQRLRWIYYVAEEFALNDLMNKTIDALRTYDLKHKEDIHVHAGEIYKNTSKWSLLRWYSAASAAWSWGRETGPATASQSDNRKKFISSGRDNPDMFANFLVVDLFYRDHIRGFDTDWRDVHDSGLSVCAFHCHAPGETCHRTGITEPAEVPEHISKTFDGVEDAVLLDRSQIIDAPSDQEISLSAQQDTPPRSPEINIHQTEIVDLSSADAESNTNSLLGAGVEPIRAGMAQSHGATNGDQEVNMHQSSTAANSRVRETEQVAKVSPAIPLAPIRNPPSTRVLPPDNGKITRSRPDYSESIKNEPPIEDLYGASDVEIDRGGSGAPMKPIQQGGGSDTYSRTNHAASDIHQIANHDKYRDENEFQNTGMKKRKAISNEKEINQGPHLAVTNCKKSKITHVGIQANTKSPESYNIVGKTQPEIQDSETDSSTEEEISEHSSSEEGDDESEEDDDEIIDDQSSDEEESSDEDEESSDAEVQEQEPGQAFIDSGIHTSTPALINSQQSFGHQGTSNSRTIAGIAPSRPGYCLIYNYKGACNKACRLQHLCLKCNLRHSSLYHDRYQPNFRGQLGHHHSPASRPHISAPIPEDRSEDIYRSEPLHLPSRRELLTRNERTSGQDARFEFPPALCQKWQQGCCRWKSKCKLAHICEQCGQSTHRTVNHGIHMSKRAPRIRT